MRHSNKERDNVAESRPGSNTVHDFCLELFDFFVDLRWFVICSHVLGDHFFLQHCI